MTVPDSFWARLAALALVAVLCRRWPLTALYGAAAALCDVARLVLLDSPDDALVVGADAFLFLAPSAVLLRACGAPAVAAGLVLPVMLALVLGDGVGAEARRAGLVFFALVLQGSAMVDGTRRELEADEPSWDRRAAVVVASAGLVGGFFSGYWPDVAAVGAASHAFVCVAYLAREKHQKI